MAKYNQRQILENLPSSMLTCRGIYEHYFFFFPLKGNEILPAGSSFPHMDLEVSVFSTEKRTDST